MGFIPRRRHAAPRGRRARDRFTIVAIAVNGGVEVHVAVNVNVDVYVNVNVPLTGSIHRDIHTHIPASPPPSVMRARSACRDVG